MGKITLDATPQGAPGCYDILGENGKSVLVQSDWEYCGTARSFGWDMRSAQKCQGCGKILKVDASNCTRFACPDCEDRVGIVCRHDTTDGTVTCKGCGMVAGEFMAAAADWMDDNDGATADDPGYFGEQ